MIGKGFLRMVPNAFKNLLIRIITTCVTLGDCNLAAPPGNKTLVCSDEWASYNFMDEPDSGYCRTGVNHSEGVYANVVGKGNNASECLFRLVRKEHKDMNHRAPRLFGVKLGIQEFKKI